MLLLLYIRHAFIAYYLVLQHITMHRDISCVLSSIYDRYIIFCSLIASNFAVRFRELFTYRRVSRTADVETVKYDHFPRHNNDQINQQKKLTLVKQV
jgi:hypothetical protein